RYVYAICMQAFRLSPNDAEDVFQEVFARIYERLDSLRSDDAVRPWIAQLTRRLCIDSLRASGRAAPTDPDLIEPPGVDETLGLLEAAMSGRAGLEATREPG